MRRKVILICTECLSRNYETTRPQNEVERYEVNKFCKHCGKHTLHKESK